MTSISNVDDGFGVRSMQVLERARTRGAALGFSEDEISEMARLGALATHPRGNLRYDNYWFVVRDDVVYEMGIFDPTTLEARVVFPEAVSCTLCDGTMRTVRVNDNDGTERIIPCPRMNDRNLPLCNS